MDITQKAKAVAESFDWYANTTNKYIDDGNWTPARTQFVDERYEVLERVKAGLAKGDYPLTIPSNVNTSKHPFSWRVVLSIPVTGFKCTEYLHLLSLQDHQTARDNLLLYRTKDHSRKLEQSATLRGSVKVRDSKVLFAGYEFPVASKVDLK